MNTNAGGLASQIAYLFRELHPDDALECEVCSTDSLLSFIADYFVVFLGGVARLCWA